VGFITLKLTVDRSLEQTIATGVVPFLTFTSHQHSGFTETKTGEKQGLAMP
jgi:hypothetical protein